MEGHHKKHTQPFINEQTAEGSGSHFIIGNHQTKKRRERRRRSRLRRIICKNRRRNNDRESTQQTRNKSCQSQSRSPPDNTAQLSEKRFIINTFCKSYSWFTIFNPFISISGDYSSTPSCVFRQKYRSNFNNDKASTSWDLLNLQKHEIEFSSSSSFDSEDDDDDHVIFCESPTISSYPVPDFEALHSTTSSESSSDSDCSFSNEEYALDDDDDDDNVDFVYLDYTYECYSSSVPNSDLGDGPNTPSSFENSSDTKESSSSVFSHPPKRKQVTFEESSSLVIVHKIIAWDYAYRAARVGPWEMIGRDASRFKRRIQALEPTLSAVLTSTHRMKIFTNRMSSIQAFQE